MYISSKLCLLFDKATMLSKGYIKKSHFVKILRLFLDWCFHMCHAYTEIVLYHMLAIQVLTLSIYESTIFFLPFLLSLSTRKFTTFFSSRFPLTFYSVIIIFNYASFLFTFSAQNSTSFLPLSAPCSIVSELIKF